MKFVLLIAGILLVNAADKPLSPKTCAKQCAPFQKSIRECPKQSRQALTSTASIQTFANESAACICQRVQHSSSECSLCLQESQAADLASSKLMNELNGLCLGNVGTDKLAERLIEIWDLKAVDGNNQTEPTQTSTETVVENATSTVIIDQNSTEKKPNSAITVMSSIVWIVLVLII